MIKDLEGKTYINARHIIALKVDRDPATLKYYVAAVVSGYMGRIYLFTSEQEEACHDYIYDISIKKNWR